MSILKPGLYKIISGSDAGALVNFYFINTSGHADCRHAEDFGPYKAGEIVVVRLDNLAPVEESPCGNATN